MRNRRPPATATTLLVTLVLAACAAPRLDTKEKTPRVTGRGTASAAAGGIDWPGFLGPHGDARSPERGLRLDWPEEGPPVLWIREIGESYSAPSVAGDRLFFFDRVEDREMLSCLDVRSGELLWSTTYPTAYEDLYGFGNGPRASPLIDGDRVYTHGAEGRLRCQRVDDGSVIWETDTSERFGVVQNFFGVGSTPVIEGELLIVPVGGSPPGSPEHVLAGEVHGNGTGIVAFDKTTGAVRWSASDELASYSSPLVRTIGERRWGLLFARGGLVGFEPETGEIDFTFPWREQELESVNAANPVVVGDTVFITESYGPGGALLRVRPGGYDLLRKDASPRDGGLRSHWATPVHHEGYLYGCSGEGGGDAVLRAVELSSGRIAWSKPGLGRTTLLYVDGHLIVLAEYGELLVVEATPERFHAISRIELREPAAEGGKPLLRHPAWTAPVLSRGRLFVRGKDRLVALDLRPAG